MRTFIGGGGRSQEEGGRRKANAKVEMQNAKVFLLKAKEFTSLENDLFAILHC
jgi:hypothetical protein